MLIKCHIICTKIFLVSQYNNERLSTTKALEDVLVVDKNYCPNIKTGNLIISEDFRTFVKIYKNCRKIYFVLLKKNIYKIIETAATFPFFYETM